MLIIDRYMLRQFLGTFLVCYLSLTGLVIVFDAFTNLDGFLRCAEKSGGLLSLMTSFYGYQAIMYFDRMSGLLTLVAAMFTVAWIQRHNEMTALMAAGISRVRVVRPLMIAGVAVALVAALNREAVMPQFRDQLSRRSQDLVGDVAQSMKPSYDNCTGVLLGGSATFRDQKRIAEPNFVMPHNLDHYGKKIVAQEAFYEPPGPDRPGGYRLVGVKEPKGLDGRPSLCLDQRPVLITRHDAAWLEPHECFVASDVTFDQLTGGQAFKQFASTWELVQGLNNPSLDYGADVRVALHSRVVQPILDATLLFLGLPLVVTRRHRNVFVAIGLGLGLVTVFMLTVIALQYLGGVCLLPASLAAWAPLMLFVPAAVAMGESMAE